jgi:formylglycine-generating enzyme required for sulfatase activity
MNLKHKRRPVWFVPTAVSTAPGPFVLVFCAFSRLLLSAAQPLNANAPPGLPSPEEYRANWPRFRGPDGGGVSFQGKAPLTCGPQSGNNIAWTANVPAEGFSSPIIWGNRLFLSGGDAERQVVMCYDTSSGKLLWQRAVPKTEGSPDKKPPVPESSGMASATVATDGRRVYAIFADGDLAAFRLDGSLAWAKHLATPKNTHGHATSLFTWRDRLIVQFDQGEAEDNLSKLYAFDGATGAVVWEQPRPVGASWASPIVFEAAGQAQIVTLSVPWVIAYSAKDGAEIWRARCLEGEIAPSPVFAGGTLFIVSPGSKVHAIRPDGRGDVTRTHLGWSAEDGLPDVASPVSNGELIFLLNNRGTLTCYDAKDGRKQWQHEMDEESSASPSIVGNRLYVITTKGTLAVFEAGRAFKSLARSALGERVFASPAFAHDRIFVRGTRSLICIGSESAPPVAGTAPGDAAAVKEHINPKDGVAMVLVPAGEFLMGSKEGQGSEGERPQRRVTLDDYYIYKCEVTVAQYRRFCQETKRPMPPEPPWKWQDAHPIVNVTWFEASAYAAWAGAALPTEAQWEKAARGTDGRTFVWGNNFTKSTCHTSDGKTVAVGLFPNGASPYGALDMAGNVWEWCADWYDPEYYAQAPPQNPPGPVTGTLRVLRGGSWGFNVSEFFRVAYRNRCLPDCKYGDYGFRCVVAPSKP